MATQKNKDLKLFLVHCGFYDDLAGSGIYEVHTNLFVIAKDFDEAKLRAKNLPEFKTKRMHVDGMQEIAQVDGYPIQVAKKTTSEETIVIGKRSVFGWANLRKNKKPKAP